MLAHADGEDSDQTGRMPRPADTRLVFYMFPLKCLVMFCYTQSFSISYPTYPLQIIPFFFGETRTDHHTRWDHVLSDMKWPDNYLHSENKGKTFLTITVIINSIIVRISEPLSTEKIFLYMDSDCT